MKDYKLYIFDWDGTLMDSIGRIVTSMQKAAEKANVTPPPAAKAKAIIGLSLAKGVEQLFPECSPEQHAQIIANYRVEYIEVNKTPSPLFDHAYQLIAGLRAKNKLLAVATGKARHGLEKNWQVENMKEFFLSSRCADDAQSKPHPEMLLQLLAEFNVKPEEALMVGDTSFDLAMAKNANVDSVGVTMGAGLLEDLLPHQPKAIVNSLKELAELVI